MIYIIWIIPANKNVFVQKETHFGENFVMLVNFLSAGVGRTKKIIMQQH